MEPRDRPGLFGARHGQVVRARERRAHSLSHRAAPRRRRRKLLRQPRTRRARIGLESRARPRRDVRVELALRSEEHTSELQSLMRISYAVFCLKKKKQKHTGLQPR